MSFPLPAFNPFAFLFEGNSNQNTVTGNSTPTPELTNTNTNQSLSDKDLEHIRILNNFNKKNTPGAWTGRQLTRSGGCVETAMTAMQYLQKELGVASGGNMIGDLEPDSKLKGRKIQDLQAAFDRGDIKPGDIITTTQEKYLKKSVHELAAGGKDLNNHAAMVTAVLNPATGKYEIRLIDNDSKTARSSTLQEYIAHIGLYSPVIHSVQKPKYEIRNDSTSTIATTKNKSLTTA
jgi:hypothetical protein